MVPAVLILSRCIKVPGDVGFRQAFPSFRNQAAKSVLLQADHLSGELP